MLNVNTQNDYIRTVERLLELSPLQRMAYIQVKKSKNTEYKLKAALQYFCANNDNENAKQSLKMLSDEQASRRFNREVAIRKDEIPEPQYLKRKSKSNDELKSGWRTLLLRRIINQRPKNSQQILIALLTGCRPKELESGIRIIVDNDEVSFKILGVKVKKEARGEIKQGMEWRTISYRLPSNDFAINLLINSIPKNQSVEITLKSRPSLAGELKLLGAGLTVGNKPFSGYNLRHNFATLLKSSNFDDVDISRALGHISMKTKGYYGRKKRSALVGADVPSKITSSHTPRPYLRQAITQDKTTNYQAGGFAPS